VKQTFRLWQKNSPLLAAICVLIAARPCTCRGEDAPVGLELGANVNESLPRLESALLDRSHTKWVRGFLPATEFITGKRSVTNDRGVQTLQRCAAEGRRNIVSIKWDFREAKWPVPAPESEREKQCFAFADELLRELRGQISILALINEVFVDTPKDGMQPNATGKIPMQQFLQRLTVHVASQNPRDPDGKPLPLSCGGFTRLDTPEMQTNPAALQLLEWCDSDPRISIVNYHLHQRDFSQWQESLGFIRKHVHTKPIIVTEFSQVWAYKARLADPVATEAPGVAFAAKHHLPDGMTVRDFINRCIASPVPQADWMEFLHSQSWYDPAFLKTASDLMEQHGVIVATYAFSQQSSGGSRQLTSNATPWLLNPIYLPSVALAPSANESAINSDWFAEYLKRKSSQN